MTPERQWLWRYDHDGEANPLVQIDASDSQDEQHERGLAECRDAQDEPARQRDERAVDQHQSHEPDQDAPVAHHQFGERSV
ncbi:MAG TPA: hypothetical protein VGU74_17090, partial [Gemmatimonadales bacterium]|nr:hypothetical protein [Gemmatimonadales bacterium]